MFIKYDKQRRIESADEKSYLAFQSIFFSEIYLEKIAVLISCLAFKPGEYKARLLNEKFPLSETDHVLSSDKINDIYQALGSDNSPLIRADKAFRCIWKLIIELHKENDVLDGDNSEEFILKKVMEIDKSGLRPSGWTV